MFPEAKRLGLRLGASGARFPENSRSSDRQAEGLAGKTNPKPHPTQPPEPASCRSGRAPFRSQSQNSSDRKGWARLLSSRSELALWPWRCPKARDPPLPVPSGTSTASSPCLPLSRPPPREGTVAISRVGSSPGKLRHSLCLLLFFVAFLTWGILRSAGTIRGPKQSSPSVLYGSTWPQVSPLSPARATLSAPFRTEGRRCQTEGSMEKGREPLE